MMNFIVQNPHYEEWMKRLIFDDDPELKFVPLGTDMYDILVMAGIFSSKSEARKNWNRSGKEIPPGFSIFEHIGSRHKAVYILNPIAGEKSV